MKTKMKSIIYLFLLTIIVSCSLDDVENTTPIRDDNFLEGEESAKNALTAIYAKYRSPEFPNLTSTNMFSGIENKTVGGFWDSYAFNKLTDDIPYLDGIYLRLYSIIDASNYLISGLEFNKTIKIPENSKKDILGQAKALRAYARFLLLRNFGEFHNVDSKYGIVIQNEPVKSKFPRNTVQESYDAIIEDLEYASTNILDVTKDNADVTQVFAKALLAKVYLFKKDFITAESISSEIIETGFELEPNYNDIFIKRWHSQEVIFAPFVDFELDERFSYDPLIGIIINPSEYFSNLRKKDPRVGIAKYNRSNPYFNPNTMYFMRRSEVYLIHAEAAIRNNKFKKGLESLNKVRDRVNLAKRNSSSKKELLQYVFEEKLLELCYETGESWFDLTRYIDNGDFDFKEMKKSLTKKEQFIYPIPLKAMEGNNKLEQNPGY